MIKLLRLFLVSFIYLASSTRSLIWRSSRMISMSAAEIQVYSTLGCKYCRIAKATLEQLHIPYSNIDITEKHDDASKVIQERVARTKATTVPQIYIGEDLIGGCDALLTSIQSGDFQNKLIAHGIQYAAPPVVSSDPMASLRAEKVNAHLPGSPLNSLDLITLSSILQHKILQLADLFVTADGSRVDYKRMSISPAFAEFKAMTAALRSVSFEDILQLSEPSRFSFFTNLYNALIIHATCVIGAPANTPADRSAFFSGRSGAVYNIGGRDWSPDDIEHGILRANYPHPSSNTSSFLPLDDPRAALALKSLDPRLHFILNCGAQSCPPIKVLVGDPEEALQLASAAYLSSEIRVDATTRKLFLPRLAMWYGADFGNNLTERVQMLLSLLPAPRRREVEVALDATFPSYKTELQETDVEYNGYNWASNDIQ